MSEQTMTAEMPEKAKKPRKKFSPLMAVLFALLIVYTVLMFFPLIWGLFESLMDGNKLESTIIPWPSDWKFSNYRCINKV